MRCRVVVGLRHRARHAGTGGGHQDEGVGAHDNEHPWAYITCEELLDREVEDPIAKRFLKDGVFHLQQLQSVPIVRLQRKIGELAAEEFRVVRSKLSELLHLV